MNIDLSFMGLLNYDYYYSFSFYGLGPVVFSNSEFISETTNLLRYLVENSFGWVIVPSQHHNTKPQTYSMPLIGFEHNPRTCDCVGKGFG
jgi:hypothetical protein